MLLLLLLSAGFLLAELAGRAIHRLLIEQSNQLKLAALLNLPLELQALAHAFRCVLCAVNEEASLAFVLQLVNAGVELIETCERVQVEADGQRWVDGRVGAASPALAEVALAHALYVPARILHVVWVQVHVIPAFPAHKVQGALRPPSYHSFEPLPTHHCVQSLQILRFWRPQAQSR